MRILHTKMSRRVMEPLAALLRDRSVPVELAALGDGDGEALLAGPVLSEDELLEAQKAGVRWVQVLTIGLEHVLSPALVESPVVLTSVSGLGAVAMAEFALARILEHAKKLRELDELQRSREWKVVWLAGLEGATITVVGLGPIGRAVAEVGRAHRMHVIGVRRHPDAGPGPCQDVRGPGALAELLPQTDYLVLAMPSTAETRGMIGRRELDAMKSGSLLVNIGRGDLVDEEALQQELATGRIAAALDVFATEPLPDGSPLWEAPGLAISPHCSSMTPGLFEEMAEMVADNIERFAAGQPLLNVVDKAAGYPRSP